MTKYLCCRHCRHLAIHIRLHDHDVPCNFYGFCLTGRIETTERNKNRDIDPGLQHYSQEIYDNANS